MGSLNKMVIVRAYFTDRGWLEGWGGGLWLKILCACKCQRLSVQPKYLSGTVLPTLETLGILFEDLYVLFGIFRRRYLVVGILGRRRMNSESGIVWEKKGQVD